MFGTPTPLETANYLRTEWDSRNPRFRLTVFSTLLEKKSVDDADFMTKLEELVSYMSDGVEELASDIEQFETGESVTTAAADIDMDFFEEGPYL